MSAFASVSAFASAPASVLFQLVQTSSHVTSSLILKNVGNLNETHIRNHLKQHDYNAPRNTAIRIFLIFKRDDTSYLRGVLSLLIAETRTNVEFHLVGSVHRSKSVPEKENSQQDELTGYNGFFPSYQHTVQHPVDNNNKVSKEKKTEF